MKRLLLLLLLASIVSAKATINLAPFPTEFEGEGVKYTQLAFQDDQRKVVYIPPQNWSFRGSASQLHLTPPPAFARADAIIETVPLPAPQALDEKGIELIRQQFKSSLPTGAQAFAIVSEEASPVQISGNIATYEITASYQNYGETFVRSVLFANLSDVQLRFKLAASKKDFDALHRAFRASLVSWQWQAPTAPATAGPNAASR